METAAISRILYLFRRKGGDHLSMRPEPGIQTPRATAHPLFGLAPGGACLDGGNCFRSRRALTPPFHPCRICIRRYAFCCAFLSGAYRPRHPLIQGSPRSMESGLSSSPKDRRPPAAVSGINIRPDTLKSSGKGVVFRLLCVILTPVDAIDRTLERNAGLCPFFFQEFRLPHPGTGKGTTAE